MPTESPGAVTRLLAEVAAGKPDAQAGLIDQVYQQLHDLASRLIRRERHDHSWGATDLVHEAYLQLFNGAAAPTKNRAYFFGAAVRAMRRLLVAHARSPQRRQRDRRLPIDDVLEVLERSQQVSMEELDQALTQLEAFAPREHEVVMLRVFGGLSVKEVAAHLDVSVATIEKDWRWARTWLYTRLRGANDDT